MINAPKSIEERYNRFLNALKTLAPTKTFAGYTVAELQAQAGDSDSPRNALITLEENKRQAIVTRDNADAVTMQMCDEIVKAVIADKEYGDDSALYEALGYVRKSDRKSGLTRKKAEAQKLKKVA